MATEELRVSCVVPASPNRVYAVFMDARQQMAFTGGRAHVEPWIGGKLHTLDLAMTGTFLTLETGRRIVLTLRTVDFPINARDSMVEITLEAVAGGTRVDVLQMGLTKILIPKLEKRWLERILEPMRQHLEKLAAE